MFAFRYLRRVAPRLFVSVIVAATPSLLGAQALGTVSGNVTTSAAAPVIGAFISLDDAPPVAQTDEAGAFRIDGVPIGNHVLHVRRGGFVEAVDSIVVSTNADQAIAITLTEKVAKLVGVTVIGTKSDLAERREQLAEVPGAVAMVEAPQIRATRQANLKDVLQFVPGVYIQPRFGAADESQISIDRK